MTFELIISDLKKKIFKPVYFLSGEESYFIDSISDYIEEHALQEADKAFNQSVVYGRDLDVSTLLGIVKRFPMMSEYQVVIVKEAQQIKKIEELESYVSSPLKSTILVLCYKYGALDKRKSFAKTIAKNAVLFESKKLYDNQVQDWVNKYLKEKNYTISVKANILLTEFLGTELSKITNELDKLIISIPSGTEINEKHIENNIGISKDYNSFELQNALGKKDILKANRIINYFGANPKNNPIVLTISTLYSFFSKVLIYHQLKSQSKENVASALKVNPFFVKDYELAARNYSLGKSIEIIGYLKEYDLRSKGMDNSSASHSDLLKELVFKIMH